MRRWGRIDCAIQREPGRAPPVIDTLLAASAIERDLVLVTLNVGDIRHSGAELLDPWNGDPAGIWSAR